MTFKPMERFWEKNYQGEYLLAKEVHYGRDPLVQRLIYNAYIFREKPAIIYYGTEFTWTELKDMVLKVAGGLQRLGVKKGDRVYLGMQNCPQFVFSYFAVHALGAVVVPGSPMFKKGELHYILSDSGSKVAILEDDLYAVYDSITDELPELEAVVVTSLTEYLPEEPTLPVPPDILIDPPECPGAIQWKDFIDGEPLAKLEQLDPEDLAQLQYTSGTTGHPKGAMLVHRNIISKCTLYSYNAKGKPEDVSLTALPLFHITGMMGSMLKAIWCGSTICIIARFDPLTALKAVDKYKITGFGAVTTMNIALINHPDADKYDLSSWTLAWMGGAPLPPAVQEKYLKRGIKLAEGYGMSETMSTVAQTFAKWIKPGAVGMPFSGVDLRIVNPETLEDVPLGEEGELWVCHESVGIGYWNKPEATAESFPAPGWVRTGDIAKIDEDGFIWLCGRLKEMIKTSGFSVFPAEVEEYMYKHPAVLECAVVGTPHEYRGEDVKAFVVLKPEYVGKVSEQELVEWAREQMSVYKYPRIIEFRDSLPKTGTGKILRKELKAEELAKANK
jgi:fatty-acyl-CoA synthase